MCQRCVFFFDCARGRVRGIRKINNYRTAPISFPSPNLSNSSFFAQLIYYTENGESPRGTLRTSPMHTQEVFRAKRAFSTSKGSIRSAAAHQTTTSENVGTMPSTTLTANAANSECGRRCTRASARPAWKATRPRNNARGPQRQSHPSPKKYPPWI